MLAKRIIPCLDVKDGRVVKGLGFNNLRDAGDPVSAAKAYGRVADELVFLDIAATLESRSTMVDLVRAVAGEVFIPLTVGGGIGSLRDIDALLNAGADKISLNSAAMKRPALIGEAASRYGSQCVVVAVDAKRKENGTWNVHVNGGTRDTGLDALQWCKTAERLGAGEILLTSIDADGSKQGYDIELTSLVAKNTGIPVIASGGAGQMKDFYDVFVEGGAEAALAASLFHYGEVDIQDLKAYLTAAGVSIRR